MFHNLGNTLFSLSKKILFINPYTFAIPYGCILIILSAIFNWIEVPPSIFSNSKNVFNVYFMKYSYYYVIFLLLPFVTFLHLIYGFGSWRNTIVPITRLLTCGFILYVMGMAFNVCSSLFGVCSVSDLNNEELICEWYGYTWTALDISGHTYHNVFGILIIVEEAAYFKFWPLIELLVEAFDFSTCRNEKHVQNVKQVLGTQVADDKITKLKSLYGKLSPLLKVNFCALAVLVILLHIANFITVIYFHTVAENVMSILLALLSWLLCYVSVFPLYGVDPASIEVHRVLLDRMENGDDVIIEAEHLISSGAKTSYDTI